MRRIFVPVAASAMLTVLVVSGLAGAQAVPPPPDAGADNLTPSELGEMPEGSVPYEETEDPTAMLKPKLDDVMSLLAPGSPEDAGGTTYGTNLESMHNYPNNFDHTWWIHAPPQANQINVKITTRLEQNYDFVYVYDSAGTLKWSTSSNLDNTWTGWIQGNKVQVRLKADSSVTNWGFRVSAIDVGVPVVVESAHPYAANTDEWKIVDGTPNDDMQQHIYQFNYIDAETNYDYVRAYDANNALLNTWTGYHTSVWSSWANTGQSKVRLTSDCCVSKQGYKTQYSNEIREARFESPHNYANSQTYSERIYGIPGSSQMKIFFDKITTESGYDYVRVYNSAGTKIAEYTGSFTNQWTPYTTGDYVTVTLTTDSSITSWGYRVTAYTSNRPPSAPLGPSPSSGATGVDRNADLSWVASSDPDGDPITYTVKFGTSNPPTTTKCTTTSTSCDVGTMSFLTTYYWQVIASDGTATTSGPVWSFTVQSNPPPNKATNPSPANGATNVDRNADGSWSGSDPNGDSLTYTVKFGTSNPPSTTKCTTTSTTCDFGTMSWSTTYYWRVDSSDGTSTTTGDVWQFTVQPNPPPNKATSPSPAHGATGVSRTADGSWSGSDPNGDSLTYTVKLGTSSPPGTTKCTTTSTTCDFGTMAYSTTYYWRVDSNDGTSTTIGDVWQFTTKANPPPNTPSSPTPADLTTNVDRSADGSWTGGDPEGETVTYTVKFGTSNPPTSTKCTTTATTCDFGTMAYSTTHYWQVIASDGTSSTSGSVWQFTTKTDPPPNTPSNPNPANGATSVSRTPTLSWTGGDPDGQAVTYTVKYGVYDPPTTVACSGISTTSCGLSGLYPETPYYWQVTSTDGSTSVTSPVWKFTTVPGPDVENAHWSDYEDGEDGWTATGYWHRAKVGETNYPNAFSGEGSFWYGREDTGTYDAGLLANSGTLISPSISLVGVPNPMFSFSSWYETEDTGAAWDTKKVYVSVDGGTTWVLLTQVSGKADHKVWATRYYDISQYSGQTIRLRFEFQTLDAFFNTYRGWYIDNVHVFQDDDHDGLSYAEEIARGGNPNVADTDGDGIGDLQDRRPAIEDLPPNWLYLGDQPIGSVNVYNREGFVDVDLEPPRDNVGVEGVDFAMRFRGSSGSGGSVSAISRLHLTVDSSTGHYVGRFPLPKTFGGGYSNLQDYTLVPKDVNGNKAVYTGAGSTRIDFMIPWYTASDPAYHDLISADIDGGTAGTASFQATSYPIKVPAPTIPADAYLPGFVPPGAVPDPTELIVDSPRDPTGGQGEEQGPLPENMLEDPTSIITDRGEVLAFGSGFWNTVWGGTKWGWENVVVPETQSFVWGSDSNGRIVGDVIAGVLVYGDVRDVALGLYEGDDIKFMLGAVGLATTFSGPGDAAYSAAKAAIKVVPTPLAKIMVKELKFLVQNPSLVQEGATALGKLAKYVGTDAARADKFLKFSNKYPESSHALLKLTKTEDFIAVETAITKYGDGVVDLYNRAGSKITDPDAFVKAADAERLLGGNVVKDFGDIAHVKGVDKTLATLTKHLDSASSGAKGYAFEAKGAAAALQRGSTVEELNRAISITFRDVKGVTRTAKYDVDAVEIITSGPKIFNEFKSAKSLTLDDSLSNQILKMKKAVDDGWANQARIIVKNDASVASTVKSYAKSNGIGVYNENLVLLNP